jgi:hypothetical protein
MSGRGATQYLAGKALAGSTSGSGHFGQANQQVDSNYCGILRKVQKELQGQDTRAKFIRFEAFQHGAPLALEAINATKPNHFQPLHLVHLHG